MGNDTAVSVRPAGTDQTHLRTHITCCETKGFSDLTEARIEYRARRLAIMFRLDSHSTDDVRQQLYLRACTALDRFDPNAGATLDHFIRLHIDFEYSNIRRDLSFTRASANVRLGDLGVEESASRGDRTSSDLRMDMDAFRSALPDELAEVIEPLAQLTASQIAREIGVHRGTVYRRIALLRHLLDDFFSDEDPPRDKDTAPSDRSFREQHRSKPCQGVEPVPDPPQYRAAECELRTDRGAA